MTVQELIEMLEDQPQDAEVRLAFQPSWPLEYRVSGVAGPIEMRNQLLMDELDDDDDDGELEAKALDEVDCDVVYIGEGGQIGYLPSIARIAFTAE